MDILGFALLAIGWLIMLVFGIILIVRAFQTSVLWGLGYLFVPFVSLIFIIMHWNVAKSPFLKMLIGLPFVIAGVVLLPESASSMSEFAE